MVFLQFTSHIVLTKCNLYSRLELTFHSFSGIEFGGDTVKSSGGISLTKPATSSPEKPSTLTAPVLSFGGSACSTGELF